jgi:hypothetical protein
MAAPKLEVLRSQLVNGLGMKFQRLHVSEVQQLNGGSVDAVRPNWKSIIHYGGLQSGSSDISACR